MMNASHTLAWAVAGALGTCSIAAPIDLTIDPSQSNINLTITVDISIADDTDSGASSLSGNIEIELDNAGNPTQITLNDMMVIMDQPMNFNWSFGFFGSADAAMTNGNLSYAMPGIPTGPVPVSGGSFVFPAVPIALGGQLAVNYDLFGAGSGSEVVNLSDQGPSNSAFAGDVMIDGETITLISTLPMNTTQPLLDGNGNQIGVVTTVGSATIVATGTAPSCQADLTGDGELNFFDVSAFLSAFSAMDPAADFTGDGEFNFFDVSAFLAAFSAGCP